MIILASYRAFEIQIMKKYGTILLAFLLGLFGALTFYLSTSVILDLFGVRESEGQYVLFVVWANWVSSVLYFTAVYGILKKRKWAFYVLLASIGILLVAEIGLQVHISNGGAYEQKTVFALLFRAALTAVFALAVYRVQRK